MGFEDGFFAEPVNQTNVFYIQAYARGQYRKGLLHCGDNPYEIKDETYNDPAYSLGYQQNDYAPDYFMQAVTTNAPKKTKKAKKFNEIEELIKYFQGVRERALEEFMCLDADCLRFARFQNKENKACADHKTDDMEEIDLKQYISEFPCEVCSQLARYGSPRENNIIKYPTRCAEHKDSGMVEYDHGLCKGCDLFAEYGTVNDQINTYLYMSPALYCYTHSTSVKVKHGDRGCAVQDCGKLALYGEVTNRPAYCEEHKT